MRCGKVRDLIAAYIDNELDERSREGVRRHIETCPACRELHGSIYKLAVQPLASAGKSEAPVYLWRKIAARLEERHERAYAPYRRPALALAAAMIVVAITLALAGMPRRDAALIGGYLSDQADFMSYLSGENGTALDMGAFGADPEDLYF